MCRGGNIFIAHLVSNCLCFKTVYVNLYVCMMFFNKIYIFNFLHILFFFSLSFKPFYFKSLKILKAQVVKLIVKTRTRSNMHEDNFAQRVKYARRDTFARK